MVLRRAAVCAALIFNALFVPAVAQDVTLSSRDGDITVSGTLLGFDGEFYRLDTVYGELTVDGTGVLCDGPGCPSLDDFVAELTVSGSASMGAVLMPALIEGFATLNGFKADRIDADFSHFSFVLKDIKTQKTAAIFRFRNTNTDEGFADLLANEADVVMALREIREGEKNRALEAGIGDLTTSGRSRVIALDALVPIVAPSNPVQKISPQSLARVFSGEIDNWSALGGPDAPIKRHAPARTTGLGQIIEDQLMAPSGLRMSENVDWHTYGMDLVQAVAEDEFALGLASFAETGNARVLILTGPCGRSLAAGRRTIKTEDYPLTAPMFLYLPARRLPKVAREFLSYVRSTSAQFVIRRSGFVDQAPEEVPVDTQGNRFTNAIAGAGAEIPLSELQRMVQVLSPMKRLTTSFRFETGSSRLDAQSRANVEQLALMLAQGRYDARRLLFVGFSDGQGAAARNQTIAQQRAEAVREAIVAASQTADLAEVSLEIDAFGEAMPMACDDSSWGRRVNRRVEVWVR